MNKIIRAKMNILNANKYNNKQIIKYFIPLFKYMWLHSLDIGHTYVHAMKPLSTL